MISSVQLATGALLFGQSFPPGAIEAFIQDKTAARQVRIASYQRLSGGAIQENWLIDVEIDADQYAGRYQWVLRCDAASAVDASLSRAEEFQVLRSVHQVGVKVPRPLWNCDDHDVIGRSFLIMEWVSGSSSGHKLTKRVGPSGNAVLAKELGRNLALLHTITPRAGLTFLPPPRHLHALACVSEYRDFLDGLDLAYPVLEWGLRWCEINAPATSKICLLHRDYRTGNYLADENGLQAVLDWEFTGWGDPREDIGWFTARCWRFGRTDLEAGGIGRLDNFLQGYNQDSSLSIDRDELRYWQTMATLRWAVIALQQAKRHLSGEQPSLELALTGRMIPELELEILNLTQGAQR